MRSETRPSCEAADSEADLPPLLRSRWLWSTRIHAVRPPERLLVDGAELARLPESDGDDVAVAVRVSLSHLGPWMRWATEAAADPVAQRARAREAELHWDQRL